MSFTIPGVEHVYPFELLVCLGYIPRVISIYKFGYNDDLDSGVEEDVWDYGGTYTYSTTADIDSISSSSALDTQDILVYGLDANWEQVEQTVTLNGQTKVTLTTPLIRVWRMINVGTTDLAGNVYLYVDGTISGGIPTVANTIRAFIEGGNNQTLMMLYTVPSGYTAHIRKLTASLGGLVSSYGTFKLWARPYGGVFALKGVIDLDTDGNSVYESVFQGWLALPEKTDFRISCLGNANNMKVSTSADFYLTKNED